MNKTDRTETQLSSKEIPALLDGSPVFDISEEKPFPILDQWKQITEDEPKIVSEMTKRNELSGKSSILQDFERKWRIRHNTEYAVCTTNGTAALHSAMFGLGVGPGDEVICPTYTWMGSITPALMLMAKPVFCEVDPKTLVIDVDDVRKRITDRTKAIVAIHLWGNVCDMDSLMSLSQESGVAVLEDCSHAHGASYKGRTVGSIGHVGAWSLQGSKAVSAGEGGVLATNDVKIFERACMLGQVNRSIDSIGDPKLKPEDLSYSHLPPMGLGVKYRAHPLAIGIATIQLEKLDELNTNRRTYIGEINKGLQDINGVNPIDQYEGAEPAAFFGYPIHYIQEEMHGLPAPVFAEALRREGVLANNNPYPLLVGDGVPVFSGGLPTNSNPYPLLHTLPLFSEGVDIFTNGRGSLCSPEIGGDYEGYSPGDLPVTETICSQLIFLPLLTKPVSGAAERILTAIRKVSENSKRIVDSLDNK